MTRQQAGLVIDEYDDAEMQTVDEDMMNDTCYMIEISMVKSNLDSKTPLLNAQL